MRRLMWAEFVAVAVLSALGAAGFARVFTGWSFFVPLTAAVVGPVAVAALGMYRHASAAATLLWSFVVFVVVTVVTVLGGTMPDAVPTGRTVREFASGLTEGWADLLTVTLPSPPEPHLLVAVMALVWAATAIAAEFAHRSRSTVAPVIPGLALYLAMSGFAASQPAGPVLPAIGAAATVLLVLLLHANRWTVIEPSGVRGRHEAGDGPRSDGTRPLSIERSAGRWTLLGLPLVAVAVIAAGTVVPRLAGRQDPFDPRTLREQRVDVAGAPDPLDGLKAELTRTPNQPLQRFVVEPVDPDLPGAVDRLRLTVLDRFDGATWSATERFTRAGGGLPPGPATDIGTAEVSHRITIANPTPGPWLPAPSRATSIEFLGGDPDLELGVDASTGVVIAVGQRRDLSYVVSAEVAQPSPEELRTLTLPPADEETRRLTEVPGLPGELRSLAERLSTPPGGATAAGTGLERLRQLQRSLAENYGYSEEVPSGSSYGRLDRFLTEDRAGYAEQFAATFAVMARALGFPTRLAYGYLIRETDPDTGEVIDHESVTSRQAHVWPEVLLGQGVWIPFEPTPARDATPPEQPDDPVSNPQDDGGVVAGELPDTSAASSGGASTTESDPPFLLPVPVIAASAVALAALLLVLILLAAKRARRARRRRRASTSDRVLGAWAEVTDRLLEVGIPVGASMTAREVVAATATRVPEPATERLAAMAPVVGVALYAPVPPTEAHATEMWDHADAFRHEVIDGRPRHRAVAAALNPRPLLTRTGGR